MRFKENSLADITCFSRTVQRGIRESGNEFSCKTHFLYVIRTKKYGSSQVGFFEQIFLLLVVENQTLNL